MASKQRSTTRWTTTLGIALLVLTGCDSIFDDPIVIHPFDPDNPTDPYCSIPQEDLFLAAPGKDAIMSIDDPDLVTPEHENAQYMRDADRVIGIRVGFDVVAIPVKVLWYHEIVNMEVAGRAVAVTHCPLTGSSLAFYRGPAGDAEFGVSGLLYRNNLVMYDRNDPHSLWPQMSRGARCGPRDGAELEMLPLVEMTWGAWREMQPYTRVLSGETGFENNYDVDPYGDYSEVDDVFWPVELDFRRFLKERVLGVVDDGGGVAYPFGELEQLGPLGVIEHAGRTSAPGGAVVFWDAAAEAAIAYSRTVDGSELTFSVVGDEIVDAETGSVWRVDGVSTDGPLAGTALEPIRESYNAFWFAWAAFEGSTSIWEAS